MGDSIRAASHYVSIVAMPLAFALVATARPALTLLVGGAYQSGVIPLAVLALGSISSIVALLVGLLAYLLAMRALKAMSNADIDLLRRTLGPRSSRICDLLSRIVVRSNEALVLFDSNDDRNGMVWGRFSRPFGL